MDRRFMTVLGVSLVFALVVSSVFYQMTARSSTAEEGRADRSKGRGRDDPPPGCRRDGQAGRHQSRQGGRPRRFPRAAFSKVEDVLDRPVISNMLLEEPVLEGRLAAKGSGLGLAPTIPVGMRAVTVRVNDVASVAGIRAAGHAVDVLVTGRPPTADGDMTSTVLQNMLVLSAGTTIQPDARGQAIQAPSVTLLATPEQAETVDARRQRREDSAGAAQFERPDHGENRRPRMSSNSTATAPAQAGRSRGDGRVPAAPRPVPVVAAGSAAAASRRPRRRPIRSW